MAEILRSKDQKDTRKRKMKWKFGKKKCPKPQSVTLLTLGKRTVTRSVPYMCYGEHNQHHHFRYAEPTSNAASHKRL